MWPGPGYFRESSVEIGCLSRLDELEPDPQRPRRIVRLLQHLPFGAFTEAPGLPEGDDSTQPWYGLHDVLQPLADQLGVEVG